MQAYDDANHLVREHAHLVPYGERTCAVHSDRPVGQSMLRAREGDPAQLSSRDVINLQRLIGNRSAVSLLRAGPGPLGDLRRAAHEHAAVDRADLESEAGPPSPVLGIVRAGGGAPVDHGIRSTMEAHLGQDLSSVKVHRDAASTESVGARAYTVGEHIVVHPSQPAPGTPAGDHLFAHELTHVVQQRSGPVDGRAAPGGIRISDPADRFERAAEATAHAVTAQRAEPGRYDRVRAAQPDAAPESEVETVQPLLIDRGASLNALHTGASNTSATAQVPADTYHKLTGWMGVARRTG